MPLCYSQSRVVLSIKTKSLSRQTKALKQLMCGTATQKANYDTRQFYYKTVQLSRDANGVTKCNI